jgi:hypothetical protein
MYIYLARTYGANPYILDGMIGLNYTKVVNDVGTATITVPGDHPAVTGLALDDELEIWRQDLHPAANTPPSIDFRGLYRGFTRRTMANGLELVDLFFFHETEILRRMVNAYPSGQFAVTVWNGVPVETAMAAIVYNNSSGRTTDLTAGATRVTAATSKVLGVDADLAGINVADYANPYRNVLTALQELASVANAIFMVWKPTAATTMWGVYVKKETLFSDRRNTVIFQLERGNLREPALDQRTMGETTVAMVGGAGDGAGRTVRTRTSAGRDVNRNNYEGFVDARHLTTTAALDAYGDGVLNDRTARPMLTFTPVQTPDCNYGEHYFWGEVVTVRYGGQSYVHRIVQVSVQYSAAGEQIQLGFEELP